MAKQVARSDRLLDANEVDGKLVVRRRGERYRKRYIILTVLSAVVLGLQVAYLIALRGNPWLWVFVLLVLLLLLALAERALSMRAAARPEIWTFDKDGDRIERNGELLQPMKELDAILFRPIFEQDRQLNEYSLVVSFKDTKRATIAEAHGLPGDKQALEQVGERISAYTGAPVREEPRQAGEWWLDR